MLWQSLIYIHVCDKVSTPTLGVAAVACLAYVGARFGSHGDYFFKLGLDLVAFASRVVSARITNIASPVSQTSQAGLGKVDIDWSLVEGVVDEIKKALMIKNNNSNNTHIFSLAELRLSASPLHMQTAVQG